MEEVKSLRSKHVNVSNKVVKGGVYVEVTGFKSVQSDVEAGFAIRNLDKAEKFDPAWRTDAQGLCNKFTSHVKGCVGPVGLGLLASTDLEERTAVFFRVFKTNDTNYVVLMCNDPTRLHIRYTTSLKSHASRSMHQGHQDPIVIPSDCYQTGRHMSRRSTGRPLRALSTST